MAVPRKKPRQQPCEEASGDAFAEIFSLCQLGHHGANKHVISLKSLYSKMSIDEFFDGFIRCLKYAMVVYKREPAVERVIEFATRFAVSLSSSQSQSGGVADTSGPAENILLDRLFNFLLEVHGAQDKAVRFRSCQLVSKLLAAMGDDAHIDDMLYERIYEAMLSRMRDKSYSVRIQAIQAVSRLQDPTNKDCPIVNAYLFLMTCDPNPEVRKAVLSVIVVSRKTLHAIMERTRDTKEIVRRTAFVVLNDKVGVKALSIAQRIQLLQTGLTERSESVRAVCSGRLLPNWLRSFKGSMLELLQGLDVENSSETCELALSALLAKTAPEDIVSAFDLLNARQVIETSQLTCESVFYWRTVCSHFKKLGVSGEVYLEKLLPTASAFVAYIKAIIGEFSSSDAGIEKQLSNDFILQQLFNMVMIVDLTDEAGRKEALRLVQFAVKSEKTSSTLLKPLMECLRIIVSNPEQRAREVCELVAELSEPTEMVEEMISKEEKRQLEVKLAGVRVAMMQAREELDLFVQKQLYEEAAKVKAKISQLESDKSDIMQQMQPRLKEHKRAECDSASTLLRCITITAELLMAPDVEQLYSSIRMSLDSLILPGIQNEEPAVRNAAVRALALICIMDTDVARKHFLLFMQAAQIDQEDVKVTALTAIFDLILAFGVENFQLSDPAKEEVEDGAAPEDDDAVPDDADGDTTITETADVLATSNSCSNSIIKILMALLDSEFTEVRTVAAEGLAKLLLSGRLVSPKVLSRLLLLWYNPLTEDDARLRHCLGAFFPMFAFANRSNQELYELAFLPTLQTIFDAPNSSPLASIDAANVAELLVQLTCSRHLVGNMADSNQTSPVHDSLALKLCNEILRAPNSFGVRVLVRALVDLQLTLADEVLSKGLNILLDDMVQVVKEKSSVKLLLKLQDKIKSVTEQAKAGESKQAAEIAPAQVEGSDENVVQEPVASFLTQPQLARKSSHLLNSEGHHRPGRKLANTTIGGADGNCSARLSDNSLMATPAPAPRKAQNMELGSSQSSESTLTPSVVRTSTQNSETTAAESQLQSKDSDADTLSQESASNTAVAHSARAPPASVRKQRKAPGKGTSKESANATTNDDTSTMSSPAASLQATSVLPMTPGMQSPERSTRSKQVENNKSTRKTRKNVEVAATKAAPVEELTSDESSSDVTLPRSVSRRRKVSAALSRKAVTKSNTAATARTPGTARSATRRSTRQSIESPSSQTLPGHVEVTRRQTRSSMGAANDANAGVVSSSKGITPAKNTPAAARSRRVQ